MISTETSKCGLTGLTLFCKLWEGCPSWLFSGQMPASTKPHLFVFGGHSGKARQKAILA